MITKALDKLIKMSMYSDFLRKVVIGSHLNSVITWSSLSAPQFANISRKLKNSFARNVSSSLCFERISDKMLVDSEIGKSPDNFSSERRIYWRLERSVFIIVF